MSVVDVLDLIEVLAGLERHAIVLSERLARGDLADALQAEMEEVRDQVLAVAARGSTGS